jgi:predicted permease
MFMQTLWQDLRYGFRMLATTPSFTAAAIITLALGIGANAAIFSLVDAAMLRSLPVYEPSQLTVFRWEAGHAAHDRSYWDYGDCLNSNVRMNASGCSFPLPVYEKMQSETTLFSGVTAFAGPFHLDMSGNGAPTIVEAELVSGSYFHTLGIGPAVGRLLMPSDNSPSAPPVAVLSYAYWQRAFAGSKSVLGRIIVLNNVPFTIVGVAAQSFTRLTPGKTQNFWLPIAASRRLSIGFWAGTALRNSQSVRFWWVVLLGRLRRGVRRAQAQAASSVIFHNLVMHVPGRPMFGRRDDPRITLVPAQQGLTGIRDLYAKPLSLLMCAVGLILLIACANVAGLLLVRGRARQKEMAVRLALGAGRARITQQLLTESVLLSALGGLLGALFASWGAYGLTRLLWDQSGHATSFVVGPDWRVVAFTASTTLAAGVLFGLMPALRSTRLEVAPALKENASTFQGDPSRLQRFFQPGDALVIAQIGLSVVLLIGAGLLARTLENLRSINPGFDTHNLLLFSIDPTKLGYKDAQIRNLYREMRDRLTSLPGIVSVSYSVDPLLGGDSWNKDVYIQGHSDKATVDLVSPGPGFFHTLRLPLLEGRTFKAADFEQAIEADEAESQENAEKQQSASGVSVVASPEKPAAPPLPVLVNRRFVHEYFPNQNPLGKRIWEDKSKVHVWEVVGVVGDAKTVNLRRAIRPTLYLPDTGGQAYFELRVAGKATALIPMIRKLVSRIDNALPLSHFQTQSKKIDGLLAQQRFVASASSAFAVLALVLACIGLYGLLSYEVSRRTRELGIRMALGARRRDVLKLVAGQGIRLTFVGLGIGVAAAWIITRFLTGSLYGVKPTDPLTFAAVSLILTGVALIACYIPARRATKVNPMVALRDE